MEGALGNRVLREIEEVSLEKVLDSWANTRLGKSHVKRTHIPELDDIALRHFEATKAPAIAISGRQLPLVYKIVSTLVSPPHLFAVLVIDVDSRFDPARLTCTAGDARHIYVQHPAQQVRSARGETHDESPTTGPVKADADAHMLYGAVTTASATRQWWGTILAGGLGHGEVTTAGWKGWLRVDREEVPGFPLGVSVERALSQREARQDIVDSARWSADSQWGGFAFREQLE